MNSIGRAYNGFDGIFSLIMKEQAHTDWRAEEFHKFS